MEQAIIHTPIGFLKLTEKDGFLTQVMYFGKTGEETPPKSPLLKEAKRQLDDYFLGELKQFDLPIKPEVSPYRLTVLQELIKVGFGDITTYKELAERTGNPKAARAVGGAMRTNPIVIIIPCHRVLPQTKKIGNYSAGGAANKEWLLTHEQQNQ